MADKNILKHDGYPLSYWLNAKWSSKYEKAHGIGELKRETIMETDGLIFQSKYVDDNTQTIIILYAVNREKDKWLCWCPTKPQALALIEKWPIFYNAIEENNKRNRLKK